MRKLLPIALSLAAAAAIPTPLLAQHPDHSGEALTLAQKTAAMTHMPGLLALDWDPKAGKLYLEVPLNSGRSEEYLYTDSLPYGTGSNDLGLDRGQTSEGRIVHFERTGPKLLLVEPNQFFRSSSEDPAEVLSIRQSFPESILAGFKVEAEAPAVSARDGAQTVLVDATDFFLRDSHGVLETLTRLNQGAYKLDPSRSNIALDRTNAFPKNTEVESILTFSTESVGGRRGNSYVAEVTPDAHSLTLREHQSFLELPPPGFTPRRFDPRAGYFPESYRDYSAPLGAPLDQQFIIRHRLLKQDPNCTRSCVPQQPIQYYVDRGAPEPIRSALVEGARWWDQAFQAAGWAPGTFKVDLLPEGADPMDIRYNMIQWVHRYTRGWSYGAAIADPRTGEIIKGNVTLGSLRGRQDYLIAEALLAPYANGRRYTPADDPMLAMVLERIRQLAAHETGHTLGLAHNFAASAYPHTNPDETISVMDYPHPWITLDKNGVPDLTHAYPVNIGVWDKVAIDYGYREFDRNGQPAEEPAELDRILEDSQKTGLLYITDEDSRPLGSAQPYASLWDNGSNPATELTRILDVRAAALARFGPANIKPGTPMAQLAETLVPLYLLHRYQTEAAIKSIGGLNYEYNLRGDNLAPPQMLSPELQQQALTAVLQTLTPATLTLPESILAILPPRPPGMMRNQEAFPAMTGLTFDPVAAAASAADLTLSVLFNPERANRLVQYHARNPAEPSLAEVIERTLATPGTASDAMQQLVASAITHRIVESLLGLAASAETGAEARAIVEQHLAQLKSTAPPDIAARIAEYERDPAKFTPAKPIQAPPGMPIGDDEDD